jgi:hypothetical protein
MEIDRIFALFNKKYTVDKLYRLYRLYYFLVAKLLHVSYFRRGVFREKNGIRNLLLYCFIYNTIIFLYTGMYDVVSINIYNIYIYNLSTSSTGFAKKQILFRARSPPSITD